LWLRAQPIPAERRSFRSPWLSTPGAKLFTTQPDGLWISFPGRNYCDLIAVEICRTIQNLNDKRSRYMHTSYSLLLTCHRRWLEEEITLYRRRAPRWELAELRQPKLNTKQRSFPVRYVSVLLALPNDVYTKWCAEIPPLSHEFYCPHSSLGSYNSQKMQAFLSGMSIAPHFYKAVAPFEGVV
jgi:hypothetical protein